MTSISDFEVLGAVSLWSQLLSASRLCPHKRSRWVGDLDPNGTKIAGRAPRRETFTLRDSESSHRKWVHSTAISASVDSTNSSCRRWGKRTMRETEVQIGNSGMNLWSGVADKMSCVSRQSRPGL